MPIRLRKFVFNKLKKYYSAQEDINPNIPKDPSKVLLPDFVKLPKSDYSTVSKSKSAKN